MRSTLAALALLFAACTTPDTPTAPPASVAPSFARSAGGIDHLTVTPAALTLAVGEWASVQVHLWRKNGSEISSTTTPLTAWYSCAVCTSPDRALFLGQSSTDTRSFAITALVAGSYVVAFADEAHDYATMMVTVTP